MKLLKKQNVFGWISIASAVLALIGMIIYISTSTTGYLAGQSMDVLPIVFTVLAMIVLVATALVADKLDERIVGGILFAVCLLLTVSFCLFVFARIQLFADVYFIPVNYPEAEGTALSSSIVGYVFYGLALIGTIAAGFSGKLNRDV